MTLKEFREQFVLFPKRRPSPDVSWKTNKMFWYSVWNKRNRLTTYMHNNPLSRWYTVYYMDGHKELAYLTEWGTLIRRGVIFRKRLDDWYVESIKALD